MEITTRPFKLEDIEIFKILIKDPETRRQTWLQLPECAQTDEILHYCFIHGVERHTILLKGEEKAVGTFSIHQNNHFAEGGIFILPDYRGQGLGRKAFHARKAILKAQGVRFLRNEIFEDNPASVQNNLKNGARPFGWWLLRIPKTPKSQESMTAKYLSSYSPLGKIELVPYCSEDLPFYRELFKEPEVQFQTYSEHDLATCPDEEATRFLMADSFRRWTVWLHSQNKKIPIGTVHLYDRNGPVSNFGFLLGKEYRGQKTGQTLLSLLKTAASQEGIKILRADVFFDSKAAIRTMEKEGFRPFGFYETFVD
jgi:RimJ/RimL family protein N-acetyltransferase